MITKPCCCSNEIPTALTKAHGGTLIFHTYGDVDMEHFYRAIAYKVTGTANMVITMPTVTKEVATFFHLCFERKWISTLILTTKDDCADLLTARLGSHMEKVSYLRSDYVSLPTSHLTIFSPASIIILNGPMLADIQKGILMTYTLIFHAFRDENDDTLIHDSLDPVITLHRISARTSPRQLSDALSSIMAKNYLS